MPALLLSVGSTVSKVEKEVHIKTYKKLKFSTGFELRTTCFEHRALTTPLKILTGFELRTTHWEHRALTTPPDVLSRTSRRYLSFYIVTVIIGLKWYILCLPQRISHSLITKKRVARLINRKPGENHHMRPVKTRHNGRAGYTHKNAHMLSKRKASSRLQFGVIVIAPLHARLRPHHQRPPRNLHIERGYGEKDVSRVCVRGTETQLVRVCLFEREANR